ncbi:helix-turn-helix domain-containing protein [Thermopolyspora sp. NPDC052614]|uniref:TetR/AcrR family transcriptional regulator n=1 Tax=Thermopolyspora sp. NPDC052614 TaxID=3155682 RepID=UPI003427C25B
MVRKSAARSGAWEWNRTAQTRRGMLDAARAVFAERGFAEAGIADVVERAGCSVGSLYHHFGGKTELYLALWEDHHRASEEAAASGVAEARQAGVTDPVELFIAGARAYLRGSWQRRDLTRLFMDGDAPPGFELVRRTRGREWVRQNAVLLGAEDTPLDRLTTAVLTVAIAEASREVAVCETEAEADELIDASVALIRRLTSASPDA